MYSGHTKPVKNEDPKYNRTRYIHKEGCECEHCAEVKIGLQPVPEDYRIFNSPSNTKPISEFFDGESAEESK